MKKICLDTSVIINGIVSELIEKGELNNVLIIIPKPVLSELENQANKGRQIGFEGIEELKKIKELTKNKDITITIKGEKPELEDIILAKSGSIDAIIREIAKENQAELYTCDYIQYNLALVEGIEAKYFESKKYEEELIIEKYFDEKTMSIHIKEDNPIYAKKGNPGNFKLVKISENIITSEEIKKIVENTIQYAERNNGLFEIDQYGATVIQLGKYRITITTPPFSERTEITVVRPIKKLTLKDYNLSDKIMERLDKAEGILIAGTPGSGKSTFATALAEYYAEKGKIVKTLENPRDLQVNEKITQYSPIKGNIELTCDILLLVRPDYTIYDEVRKTKDFLTFADMRFAGVGMVGVVHASRPIDAIQRLIGRVELGMIPQIVDTIIFMESGKIKKIYELEFVVKVPHGMKEKDLARPVILVKDFENKKVEYEIYTYGEEIVVLPIKDEFAKPKIYDYAIEGIKKLLKKHLHKIKYEIEILDQNTINLYVNKKDIPKVIGKQGERIKELEEIIGLNINVVELDNSKKYNLIEYEINKKNIFLRNELLKGKNVRMYIENEPVAILTFNSKGEVKISRSKELGKKVLNAINTGKKIEFEII